MTNYLSDKEGGPRDGPGRSGGFGEAHEVRTLHVQETQYIDLSITLLLSMLFLSMRRRKAKKELEMTAQEVLKSLDGNKE